MADRREQRATCPTCGGERFFPKILPHPTEDAYCFDKWHESSPSAAPTPQQGQKVADVPVVPDERSVAPHSSVIYTDLRVKCKGCGGYVIWRYLEDDDTIEVVHNCSARAGVAATVESPTDIFERARVALECQKKHLGDDPIDDAWIADFAAAFASTQIKMAGDPLQPATEERKEFEASVEFVGYEFNKISTGDYANRDTYHAFLGWLARSRRKTE